MKSKNNNHVSKRQAEKRGLTKNEVRSARRANKARKQRIRRILFLSVGGSVAIALVAGLIFSPLLLSQSGAHGGGSTTTTGPLDTSRFNEGGPAPLDPAAHPAQIQVENNGSYNTFPPSSGAYWQENSISFAGETINAPLDRGEYDFTLPDEAVLSNLLRGHIAIYYDCDEANPCDDDLELLRGSILSRNANIIMAPRSGIRNQNPPCNVENPRVDCTDVDSDVKKHIVLVSWQHRLFFDEVDVDGMTEFVDSYVGRGLTS